MIGWDYFFFQVFGSPGTGLMDVDELLIFFEES